MKNIILNILFKLFFFNFWIIYSIPNLEFKFNILNLYLDYNVIWIFLKNFLSSGCGCQYSPYGCCPDNATAARGPKNQGCGCEYSEFGCCPNKYTEAKGPNYEGCPCYTYQFGCCPDGVTRSRGPSFQGTDKYFQSCIPFFNSNANLILYTESV